MEQIINIRECPEWLESAADYFSAKWNIDRQLYVDSMTDSLSTEKSVPRWYLMLRGDEIIGGFGLIENDFMIRTDLYPWLCGLYIEPSERGRQLGSKLLAHGRFEADKLGFQKVYLNTDHIGYYERYGWRYMGDFSHQSGVDARVYEADTMRIETTRLILRPFTESDAEAASYNCVEIFARSVMTEQARSRTLTSLDYNSKQPIVAYHMSDMVLETEESAREWIIMTNNGLNHHEPCQILAIERKNDGKVIGLMGVAPQRTIGNEVEILFGVADEYQNNGYATEAGKAMIWWAFEQAG